jgi:hypothetical protein
MSEPIKLAINPTGSDKRDENRWIEVKPPIPADPAGEIMMRLFDPTRPEEFPLNYPYYISVDEAEKLAYQLLEIVEGVRNGET